MGQAFGSRLAADGWDLAITARRGDRLRALAGRLAGQHGVKAGTWVADLTDPGELPELERVIAAAGPDLCTRTRRSTMNWADCVCWRHATPPAPGGRRPRWAPGSNQDGGGSS